MPHRREALGRATADALRRGIDSNEVWVIALEILELPQELVERGVRYRGVLMNVIPLLVVTDLLTKLGDAGCGSPLSDDLVGWVERSDTHQYRL